MTEIIGTYSGRGSRREIKSSVEALEKDCIVDFTEYRNLGVGQIRVRATLKKKGGTE